jgi:hypothetical protein
MQGDASDSASLLHVPPKGVPYMDSSLPASDLLQSLQKITNIIYLTKHHAGDKVKVRDYMNDVETELARLKHLVAKLASLNSPQIN